MSIPISQFIPPPLSPLGGVPMFVLYVCVSIKKMWYIYTMEYYSAIERNEIGSFVEMWMDLETVIEK